jgi:hypothetical protein
MKVKCVFCEVWIAFLNIIYMNFMLDGVMYVEGVGQKSGPCTATFNDLLCFW